MTERDYFPIYEKMQESSTKITKLPSYGDDRDKIFHFDVDFARVWQHKTNMITNGRTGKFFQALQDINLAPINRFIAEKLADEYPNMFTFRHMGSSWELDYHDLTLRYTHKDDFKNAVNAFGILASVIQEDLIVVTDCGNGRDKVSALYLSMPSDWAAESAIGRSFTEIHANLPRIKQYMPNPHRLVQMMIKSPHCFERIGAVNFRDGDYLSRHEDDVEPVKFNPEDPKLFMRYERQVTKGFPEINSFLLTVKAYFEPCDNPDPKKKLAIINAFEENNPKANAHKFITENREEVLKWLKQ